MKSMLRILLLAVLMVPIGAKVNAQCSGTMCSVTIQMMDGYGDGWYDYVNEPFYVKVYQGTTLRGQATLGDGESGTQTIAVCSDDSVRFVFDGEDSYEESSFTILNGDGTTILASANCSNYTSGQTITTAEVVCPSCIAPLNLLVDATDPENVVVSWIGSANGYEVVVLPATATFDSSVAVSVTDTVVALDTLTSGTAYNVWVRTDCGGEYSAWTGPVSFVPGLYTMTANSSDTLHACGVTIVDDGGLGGSYASNQNTTLYLYPSDATQMLVLSGSSHSESNYDYVTIYSGIGTSGEVLFTDNGIDVLTTIDTIYSESPVTIVFISDFSNQYDGFQINVSCIDAPDCRRVENFACVDSMTTAHTATFTWQSDAGSFQIEYKKAEDATWTEETANDTIYELAGLDATTTYNVRVKALCGSDESRYSAVLNVTTTVACPAPSNLRAILTPGEGTVATLTWSDSTGSAWQVCFNGDTNNYIDVTETSLEFDTLTPETAYTAKVRRDCTDAEEGYSEWTATITFTPTDSYNITVNDGTTTNSYVPIYGFYVDNNIKSQFIIPAADLSTMQFGIVNKLTFYASNASVSWGAASFEVYLSETEATGVSSLNPVADMEQVYTGSLSIVNNKMEVTFTTPYQYMGGNLLVAFEQPTSGGFSSCNWYGVNATGASMGGYGSSVSQRNFLPKMTIEFTPGEEPTCFPVSGLAAIDSMTTAESVTITWIDTANSNASYNVYILGEADTTLDGTTTDTSYTFEGLQANTLYTFGVVVSCGGDEALMRTIQVRTPCVAVAFDSLPWAEGFESYTGSSSSGSSYAFNDPCWRVHDRTSSSYPYINNSYAHTGSNALATMGSSSNRTVIVLPPFEGDLSNLMLTFWQRTGSTSAYMEVGVMSNPDDASTFVSVQECRNTATSTYEQFEATFGGHTTGVIALRYNGSYNTVYVDDITVMEAPSCLRPEGVSVSDVTETGATVHIADPNEVGSYHLVMLRGTDIVVNETVTDTVVVIDTLQHSSPFKVYVSALCDDGSETGTVSATFTTSCAIVSELPWLEDFEGYSAVNSSMPMCWDRRVFNLGTGDTVASNDGPIHVSSTGNNSSQGLFLQSNCNYTYSTPASSSALVMLPLFADPLNTLTLHFDYKYTQGASVTRIEAGVYVDAFGFVPVDTVEVGPNVGEWYYYEKAFAGLADSLDTGRFAIRYTYLENNDYYYLYLDNVGVITSPECSRPDAVRDSVVSAHEVHFTIVDGTMHNNYQFVLLKGTDTVVNVNINDTTFSVDTLTPETTYTAHVWSICDDGSTTTAVSCTFTTPVSCPAPTGLRAVLTPGDGTVATLTWSDPSGSAWQICLNGDTNNYIDVTEGTSFSFDTLTPETTYTAKVRRDCTEAAEGYSTWSDVITFTPTDAYIITVNDGTTTNEYVPIYGSWVDNHIKSQFIIPAADLSAMQWGNVTKLTFHSSDANKTWNDAVFEVYLTETNATGVSSLNPVADMTQVYSGSLSIANNVMEITLTTPYLYMGGNLLVAFEEPTSGSWSACSWYGVSATGASMGGYGSYVNQRDFLPKMTIEFTPGEEPACIPVSGLTVSGITADEATLSWVGDAGSYNVYSISGADTTLVQNVSDTTITLTDLDATTQYTYGVRAVCGSDVSDIRTVVFNTACGAVSLPYTETFAATSATRDCWNFVSNNTENVGGTYGMGFVTVSNRETWRFSSYSSASDYNQYGFSPLLNVSEDATNLQVTVVYGTYGSTDQLFFGYVTANDTVWDSTSYTTNGGYSANDWQTQTFVIPATATQLAVHYYGNYQYYAWIDSVTVTAINGSTTYYTVSVSSADATMGTVSPAGATTVDEGASFTATATANDGYHFVSWTDANGGTVSTDNPYTFTVTADIALTATFEANGSTTYYTVSVSSADATMGTVSCTPSGSVEAGTSVTATATPANNHVFTGWVDATGDTVSHDNPYTFTVNADITLVGTFRYDGVGIDEAEVSNVSLFPNPATSTFTVSATGMKEATVIDLNGRTVMTQRTADGTATFDVSTLAKGTYFVRIVGEQATAVRKLVVK